MENRKAQRRFRNAGVLVGMTAAAGLLLWGCSHLTTARRDTMYVTPGALDVTVTPQAPAASALGTVTLVPEVTPISSPVVVADETPSPSPVVLDAGVTTACTNRASLITDVTMPDGTQVAPGAGFNKIWRIHNTGTCTWGNDYRIVHVGGPLLGAMAAEFPLNATVYPGQSHELTINMVSPELPGTYQSDWRLQNAQGQSFGIGGDNSPFWVKIVVADIPYTGITGLIYQDVNENGTYELGEPLVARREIRLVPSTACHTAGPIVATALSDADGRYTLRGRFDGSFCIGLVGGTGFDDGVDVSLTTGQILTQVNLRVPNPAERILFEPGATQATITGNLHTNGAKIYVMRVAASQLIEVSAAVDGTGHGLRFAIVGADGSVVRSMGEGYVRAVVPRTQDYYVELVSHVGAVSYQMSVLIPVRIRFPSGATSTEVAGSLAANGTRHYVLRALAGQRMVVVPRTSRGQVDMIISGADGQVLLSGRVASDGFDGILPTTQDYLIAVWEVGGSSADYTLGITIPPL